MNFQENNNLYDNLEQLLETTEEGTTQRIQGIESEESNSNVTINETIQIPNGNTNEADNIQNTEETSQGTESNENSFLGKKRGRKPQNPNKKYFHTPKNYDNYIIKMCRLFVNSFINFLNDRYNNTFEEIGKKFAEELKRKKIKTLNFRKIPVDKIFGQGYEKHKSFLKMSMGSVLGCKKEINEFIIGKMNDEGNDEVFNAIMEKTVEELYTNYEKDLPILNIGETRLYIRQLPTFSKAIEELKEKDPNTNVGERKGTFVELIDEEEKRQKPYKKKK